ncbi:protein IQ-DOMAIN 2-like [Apium graveolens]|uniref:protein IQ-DOMAIN 2-like n=1 Tax=Apium graveolens TaxID=4045 RepID=UPI003D794BCD
MGRKEISCFSSVKRAFSLQSRNKRKQKWKKWLGKQRSLKQKSTSETRSRSTQCHAQRPQIQTNGIVRPITRTRFTGNSREEVSAIKIQTAYRGYQARRELRSLRGLVRLRSLVESAAVKGQTTNTLQIMQGMSRVQSQINSRRIRMLEENQVLQRQLLRKRAKELEGLQASIIYPIGFLEFDMCYRISIGIHALNVVQKGEDWNHSSQSKEQIEARLLSRYEASMRRERAMAYSFSQQQKWKKSARTTNQLFMDPTNPQWGWSWFDRWVAARPESKTQKEFTNDHSSLKDARLNFAGNAVAKSYVRQQLNFDKPISACYSKLNSPRSHQSPSTPLSKARKFKPPSGGESLFSMDYDSKSMFSMDSELNRKQTIAGSSVRDDESLVSSPSVPRYMTTTRSAKAKLHTQRPFSMKKGPLEKGSAGYAKKRLLGPPMLDSTSIADNSVIDIPVN